MCILDTVTFKMLTEYNIFPRMKTMILTRKTGSSYKLYGQRFTCCAQVRNIWMIGKRMGWVNVVSETSSALWRELFTFLCFRRHTNLRVFKQWTRIQITDVNNRPRTVKISTTNATFRKILQFRWQMLKIKSVLVRSREQIMNLMGGLSLRVT